MAAGSGFQDVKFPLQSRLSGQKKGSDPNGTSLEGYGGQASKLTSWRS